MSGKERQKAKYRAKRFGVRLSQQKAQGSVVKAVARRRAAEAQVEVAPSLVFLGRNTWSASRKTYVPGPHIIASKDVFALSGLRLIEWDGDVSRIVRTAAGHRLMLLLARPRGNGWAENMARVDQRLEWVHEHARASASHRRGEYATLPAGCGFGGGKLRPSNYANSPHNAELVQQALDDPAVQRVARYVDCGLAAFLPGLHRFLSNLLSKILKDNPGIHRMFEGCCYGACHLNLHNVATRNHEDFFNILFSMCAVYASGQYDYARAGHFIAWSLGLVTQFPPGTAVFVPSASVTHANTPIPENQHRSSIAFFTSSGLGRWYQNGYMSDKDFKSQASAKQLQAWKEQRSKLWQVGLELLQPQ
ncbi:hypothetical protein C8R42DRAFT_175478 [Lentinula raphanica]|nr:hypothetical protein C8R42DRAFT_175478 [Lentinula raphanica]